jgi:hypothetical protein
VIAPKFALPLVLACTISLNAMQSVSAAATVNDITDAIQAAHVLDSSTPFRVAVEGDKLRISTFRDPHENERDRKIDAVLMARAALQASGDSISRVTVYFYGKDLSQYQEVSVSAGDIKAFASGQTSQDQLLSAITLESKRNESATDRVVTQLQNSASARPDYRVTMQNNDELIVTSPMTDAVSDEEAKMEALRVANAAIQAAPSSRTVKIAFVDPRGKAPTRQISMGAAEAKTLWDRLLGELSSVQIAKVQPAVDLASLQAVPGPLQEQRAKLLARLRDLQKSGVGIAPFMAAFQALEGTVSSGDEAAIAKGVERLSASLDAQEKAAKAAKDLHPVKTAVGGTSGKSTVNAKDSGGRWGSGRTAITADEALSNPDAVIQRKLTEVGERSGDFVRALERVAAVLTENGRAAEAAKYTQRAEALKRSGVQ